MISISAKKRELKGKKARAKDVLPGVLYGPKIKNEMISVSLKEFEKVFHKAGESSLISLELEKKKIPVLVYDLQKDAVSGQFTHVDFYQPILTEEVQAKVPLVFIGESPAIKELAGTLVKEIQELEVKALPLDLPHEIIVDVSSLNTFEDEIRVKDLNLPKGVKTEKNPEDTIAKIVPPAKVEEELEKPIEEDVEGVEKIEKEKKEEAEQAEAPEQAAPKEKKNNNT